MKNKALTIITASLITASVIALSLSLALIGNAEIEDNGIVIEDAADLTVDEDYGIADDDVALEVAPNEGENDVAVNDDVDEEIQVEPADDVIEDAETENDGAVEDNVAENVPENSKPEPDYGMPVQIGTDEYGNPIFTPSAEWDGVSLSDNKYAPCFINDVIIQVYEHATGKLVSQTVYYNDEVWETINELHREVLTLGERVSDPQTPESVPVSIPNGKYRIEVYGIWWADNGGCGNLFFAYTYGTNELIEMWRNSVLYSGGYNFIAYVDSLIADEMAKVEVGNGNVPAPEQDITYICGFSGEKVSMSAFKWNGDYHKIYEETRNTERFPYIAK